MRKFSTYLCIGLAMFFISCGTDDETKKDASNLIGDYEFYMVAETSQGDFIAGLSKNPTAENFTHTLTLSHSGPNCNHDLGTGMFPAWDESLSSGDVYFIGFTEGVCGGFEENSRFQTFWDPGTYGFSNGNEKGMKFDLAFNFESEVFYTTTGVEQPASSYARITESVPDNHEIWDGYYNFGQIVTGEFRARFVNGNDPSDFLEVSSGKFRLRVESYSEGRLDHSE